MTISKYGKTYDQTDGSEQRFGGSNEPRDGAQRGGQIGRERWEDDGGPANDAAALPLAPRPAWSVLSARDLDAAIRREQNGDDAGRVRHEAESAERRTAAAHAQAVDRAADAARVRGDRYRNAWETT